MIVPIVRTVPIVPILTIVTNVDAESGFDAISRATCSTICSDDHCLANSFPDDSVCLIRALIVHFLRRLRPYHERDP